MCRSTMMHAAIVGLATLALAGCDVTIPSDPSGTLDAVSSGVLRAGISPHDGFVDIDGTTPSGSEIEAIRGFAESLDAEVQWTVGSEEALVRDLEEGELDLVAGGLTDQTPWLDRAGVTRPYSEVTEDGRTRKLVMLVPIGENAFLSELESFLTQEHASGAGK